MVRPASLVVDNHMDGPTNIKLLHQAVNVSPSGTNANISRASLAVFTWHRMLNSAPARELVALSHRRLPGQQTKHPQN